MREIKKGEGEMKIDSIVFTDNFNNGRKSDWKVIWGAWADVGDPITRPVDFSGSEESKNLELDFGGISIFGGIHIYIG